MNKTHRFNLMLADADRDRLWWLSRRLGWSQAETVRRLLALATEAVISREEARGEGERGSGWRVAGGE